MEAEQALKIPPVPLGGEEIAFASIERHLIPGKGICEAKRVMDHLDALFRGRPQEFSPDRAWTNRPFYGW